MDKLLLIDGSNLLFQMFYGMPSRITNNLGRPIQGVIGFIGAVRAMLNEHQPSHVCILFDGEHENPRSTLYEDYKSTRIDYSTMEEIDTPFYQLNDIYKSLDFLHIPYKEVMDYEVDDYIASYVRTYQSLLPIVIASWDSDFFSLISEHVSIWRHRGKNSYLCDLDYLKKKYGIHPKQYSFFKALIGDHADNIKGVSKIGPVSAARIVNTYKTIDNLYQNLEQDPQKHLLENEKERLLLNQKLIDFYIVEALPFTIKELKYERKDFKTIDVLKAICLIQS